MSWGFGHWSTGSWGGATDVVALGNNAPTLVQRTPVPNDKGVHEAADIAIMIFDPDTDLLLNTISVSIDGVEVYDGTTFTAGHTGGVFNRVGRTLVRVMRIGGWGYNTEVRVQISAEDNAGNTLDEAWSWCTRTNPACYAGTTPLLIETALLQPLTRFLDLDVVRKTLLDNALRVRNVPQSGQRAARVAYQLAFDTEINTILNPYALRDVAALRSRVCERAPSLAIDAALVPIRARILAGIDGLRLAGVISEQYAKSFQDYLDSVQYAYRVSLAANLVLLAHSVEANDN